MRINNNMMAMNTHRQLGIAQNRGANSMEKLSSGFRINKAGDDAAGLTISEKMRGQIRGLNQASRNSQDGISLIQTAEGSLQETQNILQRMRELAVQSGNDTNVDIDREAIQNEMNQLTSEINRIGNTTEFNTQKILNGGMDQADGGSVSKATTAELTGTIDFTATNLEDAGAFAKITVGDTTFDLHEALSKDWTDMDGDGTNRAGTIADIKSALEGVQSGGVKLTDVVDISLDGSNFKFETKATGNNAEIKIEVGTEDTGKVLTFTHDNGGVSEANGVNSTVSRHGLQGNLGLDQAKRAEAKPTGEMDDYRAEIAGAGTSLTDFSGTEAASFRINDREIVLDDDYEDQAGLVEALQNKINQELGVNVVEVSATGNSVMFEAYEDITISSGGGGNLKDALGELGVTGAEAKAFDFDAGTAASFAVSTKIDGQDKDVTVNLDKHYGNIDEMIKDVQSQLDAEFGVGVVKAEVADIKDLNGFETGSNFQLVSEQKFEITAVAGTVAMTTAVLDTTNVGNAVSPREIEANSTFSLKVGNDSFVSVQLDEATYNVNSSDPNIAKSAMEDMVKDVNAALQKAGLGGEVSARLSSDNQLQFISESGKNITLQDGTNDPLEALGFDSVGMKNSGSIEQLVGPGTEGSGFNAKFQVGANQGQSMGLNIQDMRASALGITGNAGQEGFTKELNVTDGTNDLASEASLDVSTHEKAAKATTVINNALDKVSEQRSSLGAVQNRLEHTIANLDNSQENLQAAESRIRDVDMANEMMEMTKQNILQQASTAMLAQANQAPQSVLQLLG